MCNASNPLFTFYHKSITIIIVQNIAENTSLPKKLILYSTNSVTLEDYACENNERLNFTEQKLYIVLHKKTKSPFYLQIGKNIINYERKLKHQHILFIFQKIYLHSSHIRQGLHKSYSMEKKTLLESQSVLFISEKGFKMLKHT